MLADNISPMSAPISAKFDTIPKSIAVAAPPQERLRKMFDYARQQSNDNRVKAERDRDYYDGPEQLNSEVRRVLDLRKQPAIYTNRIRPTIDGVLGVLNDSRVDPQAYPRNPTETDENAADIATKTLRYIADVENFQNTILDCAENFLIEGTEACIIEADGDNIPITQIRLEEFFADPYSRRPDFKDAKYMGIAQWKDAADVRAAWPEEWEAMGDPFTYGIGGPNGAVDSTWQDRPDTAYPWIDKQRQRMMVVEIYYNDGGKWMHCIYCAAGVFVMEESPYRNVVTGEALNPIEAQSCYVNRKNERYGRIRDMIPIQDEINARRSRLLHLANSRQLQEREAGASPVDADTARLEAARSDGVIPPGWQIVPTADLASGQQLLLAESKSEIERMGPTPGVLAQDGKSRSGRASQIIQQAGMTELSRPLGRHADFQNRVYRAAWMRAQQFWTGQKFIRITDEVKAPKFLKINEPIMGPVMQPVPGPDGQPQIDPATGQPAMMQGIGVVQVKNRIAEMDVDIIVSSVPDTTTLAQEIFADLSDLVRTTGLQALFDPAFEILIEMSPLPDKARIIEKLTAAKESGQNEQLAQAAQIIQQLQAQIADLMQGQAAADKAKTESETAENLAQVEKIQADTLRTMTEPFKQVSSPVDG